MSTSTLSTTMQQDAPPSLRIETLTDSKERIGALKLVADSVAQQGTVAATALTWHPLCLSGLILALSAAVALIEDYGAAVIACSGVVLTYLAAVRYATGGYVQLAERTDWRSWLCDEKTGGEDVILGVRYGEEIIGATVLRLDSKARCAVIRGWTVKRKYRGKGLGSDMLAQAVAVAERVLGKGAEVRFAEDHANSKNFLWNNFDKEFVRIQERAEALLAKTVAAREEK
jgi:GNAT superfamily N-acetyltransferase